ncbi:Uncharacterised protein [Serratia entomophila]|nr:Uncharacterised protein [Serratia entomophila]
MDFTVFQIGNHTSRAAYIQRPFVDFCMFVDLVNTRVDLPDTRGMFPLVIGVTAIRQVFEQFLLCNQLLNFCVLLIVQLGMGIEHIENFCIVTPAPHFLAPALRPCPTFFFRHGIRRVLQLGKRHRFQLQPICQDDAFGEQILSGYTACRLVGIQPYEIDQITVYR